MTVNAVNVDELSATHKSLLDEAIKASTVAYCPYSNFQVGAALLMSDGSVIRGSNVENASYGAGICAERAALCAANAQGRRDVVACAVIGRCKSPPHSPDGPVVPPCGVCRQFLYEFQCLSGRPMTLILSNAAATKAATVQLDDILPGAFGPDDLKVDVAEYKQTPVGA